MATSPLVYEEKFVAFVDILGFKRLVDKSDRENSPEDIIRIIRRLGTENDIGIYREIGPEICPESSKINTDLCFQITQISDCVIVSAEISPAGAINIMNYCHKVSERLLFGEKLLCRGYLTMGRVVHDGYTIFGPGYQDAFNKERHAASVIVDKNIVGTPFIEIDASVDKYISCQTDTCVRTIYSRMTTDKNGKVVISPYKKFLAMIDWCFDDNRPSAETTSQLDSLLKEAQDVIDSLNANASNTVKDKIQIDAAIDDINVAINRMKDLRCEIVNNAHQWPDHTWPNL